MSLFNNGIDLQKAQTITGAVNFLLTPSKKETKDAFVKEALLFHQALSLCSFLADSVERQQTSFFEAIRVLLNLLGNSDSKKKLSLNEVNEKVNELLKQSVV